MDFNSTVKGSLLEGFYPKGWDMEKIDKCCKGRCKRGFLEPGLCARKLRKYL